jgi:phenylacetate-CoA ligase
MKRAWSRKNLWEAMPWPAKAAVGRVLGMVPPAVLLGSRFRKHLQFLREAQRWSMQQAREYQVQRLREITRLAFEKTPYYRRTFLEAGFDPRDLKSPEDLAGLPCIDRQTLRDHLAEMCTVGPDSAGVDFVSTGGSTGTPLEFYIGAGRSAVEFAYLVAGWERIGYHVDIPQAVLRGQVVGEDRSGLRHSYDPVLRRHYYSNFHMTDTNMSRYLDHMAGIGPFYLHVYPSSVGALARFMERTGRAAPATLRGILAGSENVYPEDRTLAERVMGCRFFSWYGHTEKLVMAAECEHSADYHVWPTYGYFELLDEDGRPVTTPGERGEIVGTGFINTVVPFIRYRTDDYATYVGDHCEACGRFQPIIRDIRGHRTQEVLLAADGSEVSWTALNMHDDTFARVQKFQFYQDAPGEAVLRIVPSEGFSDEDQGRMLAALNRKLEGRIALTITIADSIPLSNRGKAIYVDQRIPLAGSTA